MAAVLEEAVAAVETAAAAAAGVATVPVATPAPVTPPDTTGDTPTVSGPFTDVYSGEWYTSAVEFVHDRGLMTGVSETEFAPEADVTRAMFVTVLYRLENQAVLQTRYWDILSRT